MVAVNVSNAVSNRVLDGLHYTEMDNAWFLGKHVNSVLMNIVLRTAKSKELIELYEVKSNGRKVELINGIGTKPVLTAVALNEHNLVVVSNGYLSSNWSVINWSTVGAISFRGQIVWMHPDLNINLKLVNQNRTRVDSSYMTADLEDPFRNATEFKKWVNKGKLLRVVSWTGKRNRKGMLLKVTEVVGNKGFHFDAYFRNKLVGRDFIEFVPAPNYKFGKGGVVESNHPNTGELMFVLEAVLS